MRSLHFGDGTSLRSNLRPNQAVVNALHFILCSTCGLPRVRPKAAAENHYRCRPCRRIRERVLRQKRHAENRIVPPFVPSPVTPPPIIPTYEPVIIYSIGPIGPTHTCQYMSDGPMCGDKSLPGHSYCKTHYEICHRKGTSFKPRADWKTG